MGDTAYHLPPPLSPPALQAHPLMHSQSTPRSPTHSMTLNAVAGSQGPNLLPPCSQKVPMTFNGTCRLPHRQESRPR